MPISIEEASKLPDKIRRKKVDKLKARELLKTKAWTSKELASELGVEHSAAKWVLHYYQKEWKINKKIGFGNSIYYYIG